MIRDAASRFGAALALGLCVGTSAQGGVSAPFMFVELRMAPFQGADAAQTRQRAEAFLAAANYKILSYQDNEAVHVAEVTLPPEPEGLLAKIHHGFEKMKVIRALRALPNVSKVEEFEWGGGGVEVFFEPFIYRPQAEGLLAVLPAGAKISFDLDRLDPASSMKGLWVDLDMSGVKDPRAAAREFARRYPGEVASADIQVKQELMRVKMR
jgi:hypothetical protein